MFKCECACVYNIKNLKFLKIEFLLEIFNIIKRMHRAEYSYYYFLLLLYCVLSNLFFKKKYKNWITLRKNLFDFYYTII
jgi:hypothetical protein